MTFSLDGKEIELRDIKGKPYKVMSSNNMTKLFKKEHHGVVGQLCPFDVQTSISSAPVTSPSLIEEHYTAKYS
jgi:hypothetical protein